MKIIINNSSMVPIYEQIMEQIKAQIISGQLKENDILPSVRTMAKELKISALTVKKAYDNLEAEGMTYTRKPQKWKEKEYRYEKNKTHC